MMGGGMGGMFHGVNRGHPDEEVFGSVYDHRVVARLIPYILPYKRLVILSFAAMLVYTATQVAIPWIVMVAIDDYIVESNFAGLTWLFGIFIANLRCGFNLENRGQNRHCRGGCHVTSRARVEVECGGGFPGDNQA